MIEYFNNAVDALAREWLAADSSLRYVLAFFLAALAVFLIARAAIFIILWIRYNYFRINSKKPVNSKDDAMHLKRGILGRIARDFTSIAERGVAHVDTVTIAKLHLSRQTFLGFSFTGVMRMTERTDLFILSVGALTVLLSVDKITMAIFFIFAYLIVRLLSGLLDIKTLYERFEYEVVCYVNREIGQYFVSDAASSISFLRNTLNDRIASLEATLSGLISKMGEANDAAAREAFGKLNAAYEASLSHFKELPQMLSESIRVSSKNTELTQGMMTRFEQGFTTASAQIFSATNTLNKQADSSLAIIEGLKSNILAVSATGKAVSEELKFVQLNQQTLSDSLEQYEVSLKDVTSQIGDALGRIVEFSAEKARDDINSALKENIAKILTSNNELTERLKVLFDGLREQSARESAAIVNIKDQMDLQFEALRKDITNG